MLERAVQPLPQLLWERVPRAERLLMDWVVGGGGRLRGGPGRAVGLSS